MTGLRRAAEGEEAVSITMTIKRGIVSSFAVAALIVTAVGMPAQADSAPGDPEQPDTPTTVSASALPTVQIENGVVWDQVIVGNKVYAVGSFSAARPAGAAAGTSTVPRANILAYDIRTGVLDTSFAPVLDGQALHITKTPDGSRIYVTGDFQKVDGQWRVRIAGWDTATGQLLPNFRPTLAARGLGVTATNSTVYVGGNFTSVAPQTGATLQPRAYVAAFNATTGALQPFNADANAPVTALTMTPDLQKVVIGGRFTTLSGASGYGLGAVDPVTGARVSFPVENDVRNAGEDSSILDLYTDETGVYGTGYHFGAGGNLEGAFRADPVTGETIWIADCHGDTYSVTRLDDVLYAVSHSHYCGNIPDGYPQTEPWTQHMVNAYTVAPKGINSPDIYGYNHSAGKPAPAALYFDPQVYTGSFTGQGQAGWSIESNDEYVVMGGEFPGVNGRLQQGLARFAKSDKAPNDQGPRMSGTGWSTRAQSTAAGEVRITWAANLDRDNTTLTYRVYRGSVNTTPIYTQALTANPWFTPRPFGFTDTGRTPGSSINYIVTATDPFGNRAVSSTMAVTVADAGATSSYLAAVRADRPTLQYRLGEASGSTLDDAAGFLPMTTSGSGHQRGQAGAIPDDTDTATRFPGSNSASAGFAPQLNAPEKFTVEAWVRSSSTSGGSIVNYGNRQTGLSDTADRALYLDNTGRVSFGLYSASRVNLRSSNAINDNQWHHVVGTYEPGMMRLYVDGVRVGQRIDVTWLRQYWGNWRIGGDRVNNFPNAPSSNYLNGSIDEVAVYGRALTLAQVRAHYEATGRTTAVAPVPADAYGQSVRESDPELYWRFNEASGTTALDTSAYGSPGTYRTGAAPGAAGALAGVTNGAATFNGSSGFVVSNQTWSNPQVFSQELWFKTTTTSGGKLIGLGGANTGTSSNYDRHVYMENDGRLTFGVWTGSATTISSEHAYNDGAWHHLVTTKTPSAMRIYVDGAQVASGGPAVAEDFTGYWRVGGDTTWGPQPWFAGTIDEVAVYGTELSPAVIALHNSLGRTGEPPNALPTAAFTSTVDDLTAAFDASTSSDSDGTIATYEWDFGDGHTATGVTASHDYAAAGTYEVTLTVTDNRGGQGEHSADVTVTAPVPNVAPVAAFTSSTDGLTVSVDGSGSSDSDGTIAAYAWDFGDSATGTGVTASHEYAAPGTYSVTLTVTDDDGAEHSVSHDVTVEEPAPAVLATDAFGRTVSNGWGSADTGGAWTLSGAASLHSVSGGAGRLTANPGATPRVRLDDVSGRDVDVSQVVSLDRLSDTGTALVWVSARTSGWTSEYQAQARISQTGGVTLRIVRRLAAGDTSLANVVVPGLTYTAGTKLHLRLLAEGEGTTSLRAKLWVDGQAEPAAWTATATDSTAELQNAGGIGAAGYTPASTSGPIVFSVSNLLAIEPGAVVPVPNVAPVAAFTSSTNGLTVSVDGSGSTDSDGTIAGYAWNFGDSATGTGATASHAYAAGGTYTVTLTVTDDDGAEHSVSHDVTVVAPEPGVAAADAFGRTTATGWGSADTGGAWTLSGAASLYSVSGGAGRLTANPGATPRTRLDEVSVRDVDVTQVVSLDRLSDTGTALVWVSARTSGWTSEYQAQARISQTGGVTLRIVRRLASGDTSLANVVVPGLTYAAGDRLHLRLQAVGEGTTTLRSRLWADGQAEPAAWTATATDSTAELQNPGGIGAAGYNPASTSGAIVFSVRDVRALQIG